MGHVSELRDGGATGVGSTGALEPRPHRSNGEVAVPAAPVHTARDGHGPRRALEPEGVPEILARLRRAHGQLGGIIAMIENERSCQDIVTQLSAVGKAVQRAGFAVISQAMQQCLVDPEASDLDIDEMEKLFLRLA